MPTLQEFHYQFVPDLSFAYREEIRTMQSNTITGQETTFPEQVLEVVVTVRTIALERGSSHTILLRDPVAFSLGDEPLALPAHSSAYFLVTPQGAILESTEGESLFFFPLPEGPIAVSDTWEFTGEVQIPGQTPMEFKTAYLYAGEKEIEGSPCIQISFHSHPLNYQQVDSQGNASSGSYRREGFFSFDPALGRIVEVHHRSMFSVTAETRQISVQVSDTITLEKIIPGMIPKPE